MAGPFPEREDPAACHFCGRPAPSRDDWRTVTLHPGNGPTHTTEVRVPRCAACRRRNRILASSAVVGYCALVLAGAYFAAELAVNDLGLSDSSARYARVISIAAVLFIGLMVLVIAIPVWTWCFFRNDPEVAWWRDLGWGFVDPRQKAG